MIREYKKILIAGGKGFLGQNVAKNLKEKNLNFVILDLVDGYDFRDFQKTLDIFEKEKFDAVIHCAAYVGGIQFGYKHQGEMFYNNIQMTSNLMEAARLAGVKRFVNPISNCVYPAHLSLFLEDELWSGPLHESVLSYGLARKASWVQGWSYQKQYGFDSVHLILSNMYGPHDHFEEEKSHALGALIMKFSEAKKKNNPEVVVWGTGKPVREWLYVEDGAEALVKGLFIESHIDPINIGLGKGISVAELAEAIKREVGYEGKIVFDTSKPDGAFMKTMDNKKMLEIFKWQPRTEIEEGIKKTIKYYNDHVSH